MGDQSCILTKNGLITKILLHSIVLCKRLGVCVYMCVLTPKNATFRNNQDTVYI